MYSGDTNGRSTLTSMKTRGEIRFSGWVSISFYAFGIRYDVAYVKDVKRYFTGFKQSLFLLYTMNMSIACF